MGHSERQLRRIGLFRRALLVLLLLTLAFAPVAIGEMDERSCAAGTNAGSQILQAYLVSRSLTTFPGLASHRFIAIGRYPGDPAAEIISFSHERGFAGRNYDRALRKDRRAWLRLESSLRKNRKWLRGVNAALIPAPASIVRQYAVNLIEDLRYNIFGTNSNTLAQAIANRASAGEVWVYENRIFGALGSRQWTRVKFHPPGEQILLAEDRSEVLWCPAEGEVPPGMVASAPALAFAVQMSSDQTSSAQTSAQTPSAETPSAQTPSAQTPSN